MLIYIYRRFNDTLGRNWQSLSAVDFMSVLSLIRYTRCIRYVSRLFSFKIVVDTWEFSILLLYILWDDWPIFYDFSFKWTATAAIGIHPTKVWLSQLVNFKNTIWHFRRTRCNKILFQTWKKCHRNVWNASDCFWSILPELSISFWVA